MNTIPFTQYLRPDGRKVEVACATPKGWEEVVPRLLDRGILFSCEVLSSGHVALYAGDGNGDFATEISTNDPEIFGYVERLLKSAEAHCQEPVQ